MASPTDLRVESHGIRELFTQDARWQAWLDVEAALADAQADLGMIPRDAANEIMAKADLSIFDREKLDEGFRRTAHMLVPLVWELSRQCEEPAGNYVHWGATTQNIVQTGDLLLLREAHGRILGLIGDCLGAMATLAEEHAETVLPGRTHGQHAVPATFGYKVAVWIDELCRHAERLSGAESRLFVAMLGGAAGTLASMGDYGRSVQDKMAEKLGMGSMAVPSRAIGDHQAEYTALLALFGATASKIAREVYTGMKQEFGELEEPVPPGTVGSSTMPQKRNPFLSQDIVAAAAEMRALLPLAMEAMQTEHEADRATSLMLRRALQDTAALAGDILVRLKWMMGSLTVDAARMRQNLDLGGGLIMAEALMLSLGEAIGRQEAHDVVYDAAQASATTGKAFQDLLAADDRVTSHLDAGRIAELLDPAAYVGECATMAREQAAVAREVAATLKPA